MVTQPRLLMIVPSRGRPQNIAALWDTWQATAGPEASLLIALDDDDPELENYRGLPHQPPMVAGPRLRLGGTLNEIALEYGGLFDAVGFMGDDHRARTPGWTARFLNELDRLSTGIVYGNDLIHGPALPTAAAMTTDIVATLGYMVPAGLVHMWIDNAWKAWGEGVGRLSYLPDVILEHVHPLVGKAPTDDLYAETEALMGPDGERWNAYQLMGGLAADVERLQAMIRAKETARG